MRERPDEAIRLVDVACGVCGGADAELIGSGYDYEYWTAPNLFHAHRCGLCGNVYINPRPHVGELSRIYPPTYHSLDFSAERFSVVHKVRSRLEARRLLKYCDGAPPDARILDVGCGDGFHVRLLQRYGSPGWTIEGADVDSRALKAASAGASGVTFHEGTIEQLDLPPSHYDVVYMIQTIEHVADPYAVFAAVWRILKPGGRLVVVTDDTDSFDARWFGRGLWGGYHFPRHWNLFNRSSLRFLAGRAGYATDRVESIVSPVNWVYSIHNSLVARGAPGWIVNRFTLDSPVSLGVFTLVDLVLRAAGRGALLGGYFRKPAGQS